MSIDIYLPHELRDEDDDEDFENRELQQLVSPGDVITRDVGYMRGHGTYTASAAADDRGGGGGGDALVASVAGVVQRVNKLISVTPLKTKYAGEIGDVVVGRVTEVQQKRWKLDTNGRLDSVLLLSAVNLPGGELRRRSAEDELTMRKYLQEGDLVSAEVQSLYSDGSLALHTRSLRYGKLSQGSLVKVSPSLVKRRKTHFHKLACGASVILGNNGFVWISPLRPEDEESDGGGGGGGGFAQDLSAVSRSERETISRVRNCVLSLASAGVALWDTSLTYAFDASLKYLNVSELLKPEAMNDVARLTKQQIDLEQNT